MFVTFDLQLNTRYADGYVYDDGDGGDSDDGDSDDGDSDDADSDGYADSDDGDSDDQVIVMMVIVMIR
jgi:hypothetical protein